MINYNKYNGLGSGENGQFTFLDIIALISFFIALENLDENLSQTDKQELQEDLSNSINKILQEIHGHLQMQDEKIDQILKELKNDSR